MDRRQTDERLDMGGYMLHFEEWRLDEDDPWTPIKAARTESGDYIGDHDMAIFLASKGIMPELSDPGHAVCSIGFSAQEDKWYGWSHRACYGFGVGDTVSEGDCTATSGWVDGVRPDGTPDPLPLPVGFTAQTLDDAKRMAIAFAASVS